MTMIRTGIPPRGEQKVDQIRKETNVLGGSIVVVMIGRLSL
jgi:hypothetical protein